MDGCPASNVPARACPICSRAWGLCVFPVVFHGPVAFDVRYYPGSLRFPDFSLVGGISRCRTRGTELEADLGIRLFDRTTRRVELTKAGADFSHAARKRGQFICQEH